MKRTILIYGIALAALVFILKYLEYRFFVRDVSLEFYIGLLAVFFTGLGIWTGLRLTRKQVITIGPEFALNEIELGRLGISKREHEFRVA